MGQVVGMKAVGIATMDLEGRAHLIETDEPFDQSKVLITDDYLNIGNLYFPRFFFTNVDLFDAEGVQQYKEYVEKQRKEADLT